MPKLRKYGKGCYVILQYNYDMTTPPTAIAGVGAKDFAQLGYSFDDLPKYDDKVREFMLSATADYLHSYTDLDEKLLYPGVDCDIVDFISEDISWMNILDKPICWDTKDLSLLWLNKKYTIIAPNTSCSYHVKQLGYNAEKNTIRYEVFCLDFQYFTDPAQQFPIPLAYMIFDLTIEDCEDLLTVLPVAYVDKVITFPNFYKYAKDTVNSSGASKKTKEFFMLFLKKLNYFLYDCTSAKDKEFASISVLIQQLLGNIIAYNQQLNKYGKTMSHPSKTVDRQYNIYHVAESAQPDTRRVRTLGPSRIYVKSASKPQTPTMDKIIHYRVGEWEVRDHMRHYKTGKVVPVRGHINHRKCVNIVTDAPTPGTHYKIKD